MFVTCSAAMRPEQPDLIARLVVEADGHVFASKDYLRQYGRPKSPTDLKGHRIVSSGDHEALIGDLRRVGLEPTRENLRFGSDCGLVMWEMTRRGLGMCLMASDIAARTPDVERVFPDMEPMTFPVWLISHRELYTSRRIRLVYDVLAEFLSKKREASS